MIGAITPLRSRPRYRRGRRPAGSKRGDCSNYLIKKFSFFSLVPFISSRIQIGVMPRPVHFSFGSFFDWYFGCCFARLPARDLATRAAVDPAERLPFVLV